MQFLTGMRNLFTSAAAEVYSPVHAEMGNLCCGLFGIGVYRPYVQIFGIIFCFYQDEQMTCAFATSLFDKCGSTVSKLLASKRDMVVPGIASRLHCSV